MFFSNCWRTAAAQSLLKGAGHIIASAEKSSHFLFIAGYFSYSEQLISPIGCDHFHHSVDREPYFVGKDVTVILGYSNPRDAVAKHVDEEDKGVVNCDTLGGTQEMTVINKSGLYSLILSIRRKLQASD